MVGAGGGGGETLLQIPELGQYIDFAKAIIFLSNLKCTFSATGK